MELVLSFLIGGIIGFVTSVFVYRNNTKAISKIADKVDTIYDKVEDIVKPAEKKTRARRTTGK